MTIVVAGGANEITASVTLEHGGPTVRQKWRRTSPGCWAQETPTGTGGDGRPIVLKPGTDQVLAALVEALEEVGSIARDVVKLEAP